MVDKELSKLKVLLENETHNEQVFLLSIFNRITKLHPVIRRWLQKPISDGELHMEMPEVEEV